MKGPTTRQAALLRFIADFIGREGLPPSLKDMRDFLRVTSSTAPHDMLIALEKKGYLARRPRISRGTTLTQKGQAFLANRVEEFERSQLG